MKDMYLIMRCHPLSDQYECDADRYPIALTEDYEEWFKENKPTYDFEVWKYEDKVFECIKSYDECIEEGMAFYYWEGEGTDCEKTPPHVIAKYPNADKHFPIPKRVLKEMEDPCAEIYQDNLNRDGCLSWLNIESNRYYVYGDYNDAHYNTGF